MSIGNVINQERRNFLKGCLLSMGLILYSYLALERALAQAVIGNSGQIGILYSTATGVVLRTINPGPTDTAHLPWLKNNLPSGTALLTINKSAVNADDLNMPNVETLISYVQTNNSITLSFGKICSVVNVITNKVVNVVLCCPTLYQQNVVAPNATLLLVQQASNIGDTYNPSTGTITPAPVAV